MRLVEIAGHLIDPGKVSYVGTVDIRSGNTGRLFFSVIVDGWELDWNFDSTTDALTTRHNLIAAIESAQPEMTELEATPPGTFMGLSASIQTGKESNCSEPSDALVGVEPDPLDWGQSIDPLTGSIIAADRAAGVRAEFGLDAPPLSCPFDCNDEVPNTVPCRLCVVTGTRAERRARC